MALINPHINFNGNAEEAFNFYKSVFGGEFLKIMRFKDIASAEFPVAENETVETLAQKIHETEFEIFPKAINLVLNKG